MLVASDAHQTRIAVLEDDRLAEIFVERHRHRGVVGNVYKGRVTRVLPGMQAAFVDIGPERDAFLYVSDVGANFETLEEIESGEASEDLPSQLPEHQPSIDELLRQGQEILVQAIKDPLSSKGARVSMQITLPGRFLVFLPTVRHSGVSRKIEAEEERERLRAVLEELPGSPGGFIVRTAGEGRELADFASDRDYLLKLWERLRLRAERVSPPTLIHQDLGLAQRVVRDLFSEQYSLLWVDGEETYERIVEFPDQGQPALVRRVRL